MWGGWAGQSEGVAEMACRRGTCSFATKIRLEFIASPSFATMTIAGANCQSSE